MRDILLKNKKPVLLLFCLCFLFYGNTLKNKYSLDDEYVTVTNFPIKGQQYYPNHSLVSKGFKGIPKIWKSRYSHDNNDASDYRPFTTTTFAIEYGLFGQNPFISHLINILLYSITVCLLYCVLIKLFQEYENKFTLAFICSLLFLIHPVHTEVVASLKNRDEILAFLLALGALWFSIAAYEKPSFKNFLFIVVLLILGSLSKRSAIIFVGVIPLALVFFRQANLKKGLYFMLCFIILISITSIIKNNFIEENASRQFYHFENPLFMSKMPLLTRLIIGMKAFGFYVRFLLFPFPFRFYYGVNTFDVSQQLNYYFFIGTAFVATCAYFIYKSKSKLLLFSVLLFCGSILPFLNIGTPAPGILAERFIYSASFGFCMILTLILTHYLKNITLHKITHLFAKPLVYILPLIIVCMFYVWNRNTNWYNKLSLFEADSKHLENSSKANSLLGNEYFELLRTPNPKYPLPVVINKAINHYELAVKNDSTIYTAYNNAGVVYFSYLNDLNKAQYYFSLAIRHKPEYPQAFENLGNVFKQKKEYDKAISYYLKALKDEPKQFNSAFEITNCLIAQKKYRTCILVCDAFLKSFPANYTLLVQKGNCFVFMDKKQESIKYFELAYAINPNDPLRNYINSLADTPTK